ncbi:hypothetical protein CHELA17_40097 [Chelatococcus asaccharovorans]|mgnify:FL=1|nr:hypothetical protein CHELA17_40097 [Chelatococcus asaccharovorans]
MEGRPDAKALMMVMAECLIPGFDGAIFSAEWEDALWGRFTMGAPRRQRRSVERYNIVMSGRHPLIKDFFSVMCFSWVRSCLRPVDAEVSAGPDGVR